MKQLIKRYPALTFLVLMVVLGWTAVTIGLIVMPVDPEVGVTGAHVGLIFLIASPSVVGILFTMVFDGREGLKELLSRTVRWRVHPIWYAAALLVPIGMFGLSYVIQGLLGTPITPFNIVVKKLVTFFIPVALTAALLEEFGWRGFALPRLQRRYNALVSALIVGVGWALWHAAINYLGMSAQIGTMIIPYLILLALWAIGEAVLMAWIHNNARNSMLLVLLCHFSLTCGSAFGLSNASAEDEIRGALILAVIHWVVVIAIIALTGAKRLVRG